MPTDKIYEREISDFVTLMYHKGYRGKFELHNITNNQPVTAGTLEECLKMFIQLYSKENRQNASLQLHTYTHYVHASDHIKCVFETAFDPVKGFRVQGATITDAMTDGEHKYSLINNHQIPGGNSLQGLFPRPKPWERHKRGFRP